MTVVNVKTAPKGSYVYIGRPNRFYGLPGSKWQNPYVAGKDCETVEGAIRLYAVHLLGHEKLLKELPELRGRNLGCWCKEPGKHNPCHGDLLKTVCEMSYEEAKEYLTEYARGGQGEMKL